MLYTTYSHLKVKTTTTTSTTTYFLALGIPETRGHATMFDRKPIAKQTIKPQIKFKLNGRTDPVTLTACFEYYPCKQVTLQYKWHSSYSAEF